jgi:uncharacterized repeat protein (TIGR01451 family)
LDSLLSAVSGQFGKALIFGTLLPVIVFGLLAWLLVVPLLPGDLRVLDAFTALEPEWRLAVASFAILVMAGLLLSLNTPLIRVYEGYPWRESWIGQWCVRRQQARFDALWSRWRGMRTLAYAVTDHSSPPATAAARQRKVAARWSKIGSAVNREFPNKRDQVLPTRLGNVIRSFERYPDVQYSMEAILLWPRMIGVMDKDYAVAVDESKSSFDFMINSSVLSAATAASILLAGLAYPVPLQVPGRWLGWLLQVVAFAFLSYWFYSASIARAAEWGEMVKGAFDLYRGALLEKLGYSARPATLVEERALWDGISRQLIYGDSPRVGPPPYSTGGCAGRGNAPQLGLEIGRGVRRTADPRELLVTLRITNADPGQRTAKNVVVTDTLPELYDYEWDSATLAGNPVPVPVPVTGSNPIELAVGDLPHGQSVDLTYRLIGRPES